MARIIPLKRDVEPPPGDDATSPQGCAGGPAEIILFPGVRYERWHGEHDVAVSRRGAGTHAQVTVRDWLDI